MSEDSKDEDTVEAVAEEPVLEEPVVEEPVVEEPVAEEPVAEEPKVETAPPTDKPAKRGTSPVSWLAMFLSFLTLAAVGYMVMEDRRTQEATEAGGDSIAQLSGRVDESRQSLSELDRNLTDLASSDESMRSRVESLQQSIEERVRLLDTLPLRMSNLENSVAALQGVSAGARDTWLLAEAEYYMQIANAQLQLGNNPHLATLALGMADERVVQMANPALTDVRRAIADELAALEVMNKPDIEGVSLTLASLSRVVESLPLQSVDQGAADDEQGVDPELSGTARAWASVKGAVSGLVKVTPPDEAARALLTPDTAQLIRANLALQLQAARLALLRGEQAIFEQSLDDADALLEHYFDTSRAPVDSARQTIAEIRDGMFAVTPPDISESLRLIRQFRVLAETAQ
ncbi:MAG: uroporphyrinogen-III C-methyltransferase [Woeseiaceae bacterium]|nr:uroporphyrinogen-III C-methyltransferase [Woeseiaceae bacterium]